MNKLFEENILVEQKRGDYFSYIVNDANLFLPTEFKVLQNRSVDCLVRCMKMKFNGKLELLYMYDNKKPLDSCISLLDENNFTTMLSNLFSSLIKIKNNGFLDCCRVMTSFDKIFVDVKTYEVNLVYVPISTRIHKDFQTLENEVRTELIKLISGLDKLSTPRMIQVKSDLQNGNLSLKDLNAKYRGVSSVSYRSYGSGGLTSGGLNSGNATLRLMKSPLNLEMRIGSKPFTIGKKNTCDGVINNNKMISRHHCRINREGQQFFITDLKSSNGTYLNNNQLMPNSKVRLTDGDIVKLANMEFAFR